LNKQIKDYRVTYDVVDKEWLKVANEVNALVPIQPISDIETKDLVVTEPIK